jgi:hypothetical protein
MTGLLLLASLALADEPQIISVPSGSTVTIGAKSPKTIDYQAYLLPEPHYDSCLISAKNLPICKDSLSYCEERSDWVLSSARETFDLAREQFDSDEALVATQAAQIVQLDADLARERATLQRVRSQRTTAWAITGGLVLGAVTVTTLTLAN